MPKLCLKTSQSTLLATTLPLFHARVRFGPALKHTLNNDATRCFSPRGRETNAGEDKSQMISDHKSSMEDGTTGEAMPKSQGLSEKRMKSLPPNPEVPSKNGNGAPLTEYRLISRKDIYSSNRTKFSPPPDESQVLPGGDGFSRANQKRFVGAEKLDESRVSVNDCKDVESSPAVYQKIGKEKRNSIPSTLKFSMRGPRETVTGEKLSQPKQTSLDQKLSGKSALASGQIPSELRGSSKAKINETSKERKNPKDKYKNAAPKLSLLEELFPEEVSEAAAPDVIDEGEEVISRLPLVDFDDGDDVYDDAQNWKHSEDDRMGGPNPQDALHGWNLAVLALSRASKSLTESDFRRIAPRGHHIDKWRSPGDFLKVIPARNQSTLRQAEHYFLLFPNLEYARAYQSHVVSLHRIARTHTPTSIESPMSPPPDMLVDGEDVYSVLQNYALCPPSQKISLRIVYPPYSTGLKRLLELRGYPQIMKPENRGCKLVLFWVDGFQPTIHDIRDWITSDEDNRGLPWALADSLKPAVEKVDSAAPREWEEAEFGATEPAETTRFRGLYPRYLIHFADEEEARRFTRAWHRRPFPLPNDRLPSREPPPLVHAELVW